MFNNLLLNKYEICQDHTKKQYRCYIIAAVLFTSLCVFYFIPLGTVKPGALNTALL